MSMLLDTLSEALHISLLVLVMMIAVDFVDVRSRGRFRAFVTGGAGRQYLTSAFLGATPGCMGSFLNVSMYIHGFLSFGALVGGMIATCGDEAFVMLALFPEKALPLFAFLFAIAIPLAWISDRIVQKLGISVSRDCALHQIHEREKERSFTHYLKAHIWKHIIKKHIWRVFLWTFFAMLLVNLGLQETDLQTYLEEHLGLVLLIAVLLGVIPESGPHLVIITLYAQGLLPFSVLLASSISQDGHGMLPLLSYSLRDSILVKLFNVVAALLVGGLAFWMGW